MSYLFVDIGAFVFVVGCVPGSGAPERGRKTEDDFFLFSQQQGTGGERRKMPKPVSTKLADLQPPITVCTII